MTQLFVRLLLSILFFSQLNSCGSVPLTTLIKIANLDVKTIASIQPSDIRVRVSVDEPVKLKKQDVRLELSFFFKDSSPQKFSYILKFINLTHLKSDSFWFSKSPARNIYLFKLTKVGTIKFKENQQIYQKRGQIKSYRWNIYYHLEDQTHLNDRLVLDLELKLSQSESYFYLLKNAKLKIMPGSSTQD